MKEGNAALEEPYTCLYIVRRKVSGKIVWEEEYIQKSLGKYQVR